MEFVGNYASCGLSPQTDGMPVIQEKVPGNIPGTFLFIGWKNTAVDSFSHTGPLFDTRQDAPIRLKIEIYIV